MYLYNINIKNVGPFSNSRITLSDLNLNFSHLILTGENGTGKSIILDAVRTILYGPFAFNINRDIIRDEANFKIELILGTPEKLINLTTSQMSVGKTRNIGVDTNDFEFNTHLYNRISKKYSTNWILDYWESSLSNDTSKISSIQSVDPAEIFLNSLSGIHLNSSIVKTLAFFDYLKDSKSSNEAELGNYLYNIAVKIINNSINDGEFLHISRRTFEPIFSQHGYEVSINKLSSASLYIIQRMISLLAKAYAAHILNNTPIHDITQVPGFLLIDEAENHLHPKWQKVFLKNILSVFPNLQIITSTHSPFIVSSIENAKIYVCKASKKECYVEDETDYYTNMPIEEIIRTDLFSTDSFNSEISTLLKQRRLAIENNDITVAKDIEQRLLTINPEYFRYLKINDL